MKKILLNSVKLIVLYLLGFSYTLPMAETIGIEKALLYDQYTLSDSYAYKETTRQFQWDKIAAFLTAMGQMQSEPVSWGILQNYKNKHGTPPMVKNSRIDEYGRVADAFNVQRYQSTPLYTADDLLVPERYVVDGALVKIMDGSNADSDEGGFVKVIVVGISYTDEWMVPKKYIHFIEDVATFQKVVFVDRTNQNISTLERADSKWLVRSMNPTTTGRQHPPYQMPTPTGIFVIQEKKKVMNYIKDGTTEIGGSAPYASRFSSGAYLHGIPVDLPRTGTVEISASLGTVPRSHKCVRNATSHARFIYGWAPTEQTLVVVYD